MSYVDPKDRGADVGQQLAALVRGFNIAFSTAATKIGGPGVIEFNGMKLTEDLADIRDVIAQGFADVVDAIDRLSPGA